MKVTRGLFLGFIVGAVVGLVIYLRQQQMRTGDPNARMLRINLGEGERPSRPPVQKKPAQPTSTSPAAPDPLTEIRGIGPVYARRLQEAGIHTFTALAAATPAQLSEIIGPRAQLANLNDWIAAAKKLS